MYTVRAILVSCSVFVLVYVLVSVVICGLWRPVAGLLRLSSPGRLANLIYGIRMSPLALAVIAVSVFTVPSFLRFEPLVSNEDVGVLPVVLSGGLLLLLVIGVRRGWAAYSRTEGWVHRCMAGSSPYDSGRNIAVVSSPEAPPVALAGIRKSTVLISSAAQASLTVPELRCTIAHELAHARARDNLKKLFLHACAFPGLAKLEDTWLAAIEFAADAAAVNSDADAVELASALVKVSRLNLGPLPAIVTGLAQAPSPLLAARVQRLLDRDGGGGAEFAPRGLLTAGFCALSLAVALNYEGLLRAAHQFTEFLVR
jgi:Zn-dependent protease with chaperone function